MSLTPVLFIHAFPLDARMWRPQRDAIRASRRVIAPDLRGFGRNLDGVLFESIDLHARALVDMLDQVSIARAVVVGLSMGGYIALAMVRCARDRVAGLLLADTRAEADTQEQKRARDERMGRIEREGTGFLAGEMIPQLLADTSPQNTRVDVGRMILEQDPRGVMAAIRALRNRPDSTPLLGTIDVPTRLVCGEMDAITPPSIMAEMAARIPGAALSVIPRAGHLSNLEAPDIFCQALTDLLANVDALGRGC